jgi:6-phosphogluconolactonase
MTSPGERKIIRVADAEAIANTAADRIIRRMGTNPGTIAICLAGGSTPKKLYQLLATDAYSARIPWHRVQWFIGDERLVAPTDPLNNMGMARGVLLDRLAPDSNIHPIATDTTDPDRSALLYERELKSFYGADRPDPRRPLFDVVLLGIGPDGHTASLFPGDAALQETERWVIGVAKAHVPPFVPRVTLTLPVLASCREMLFLVAGADKRAILTRVLGGEKLPASCAHAVGETIFLADEAALPENFLGH